MPASSLEQIVSLAKRRGFVFPSSAVYGGLGSTWDYGPLGVELKNNVKRAWWRSVVYDRDDMEGLDAAILMNRLVWKYSGHEKTFSDPMTDCRNCKARPRADHVFVAQKGRDPKGLAEINAAIAAKELKCPKCGSTDLTEARPFNLMFRTTVGAVDTGDDSGLAYLRPETAQGIFVNFGNVLDTMRRKLPFGVAQIGKAFRNEITPGNFTFRTREFEQMEIEYFVKPGEDEAAHQAWIDARTQWYVDLGMRRENLRQREQDKDRARPLRQALRRPRVQIPDGLERARGDRQPHRLRSQGPQPQPGEPGRGRRAEVLRSGAEEAHRPLRDRAVGGRGSRDAGVPVRRLRRVAGQGAARRGDGEAAGAGGQLREVRGEAGRQADGGRDEGAAAGRRREDRRRAARHAPGAAGAVGRRGRQPASRCSRRCAASRRSWARSSRARCCTCTRGWRPSRPPSSRSRRTSRAWWRWRAAIKKDLQAAGLRTVYDDTGAIGKLYRRQDEIGTPFCITVDFQSLEDRTVTVRDRDTHEPGAGRRRRAGRGPAAKVG